MVDQAELVQTSLFPCPNVKRLLTGGFGFNEAECSTGILCGAYAFSVQVFYEIQPLIAEDVNSYENSIHNI